MQLNLGKVKVVSFDIFDTVINIKRIRWIRDIIGGLDSATAGEQAKRIRQDLLCQNRPIVDTLLLLEAITKEGSASVQRSIMQEIDGIKQIKGVKQLLEKISLKYKVAVISNLGQDFGRPALRTIMHPIDYPVFSYEVGHAKPSPQIFRDLIYKSAVAPEAVLHIGNSFTSDYEGAVNFGFQAIHLDLKNENLTENRIGNILELEQVLGM